MKIGIVRRNGLGDLLAVQPLILLCKERYPDCHLTLFVDSRNAELVPYLRGVDETVIIEPSKNKYISLLKTVWKNRHRKFDWVISARPKPMQWINLFLAGLNTLKRRAVVDGAWHSRWIDEPQPYGGPGEKRHQMVKTLRLLDASFEEVPQHFLPRLKVESTHLFDEPTLLVSVSNHRIGSQLDSDKIAQHLNTAFKNKSFQVVISCSPNDLTRAKCIADHLQMPHEIVMTPCFETFMALLASVHGSWTGDGGIMHLMAALDKPQLVLFGKTELWEWGPLSKKAICIRHPENVNLISHDEIHKGLEVLVNELR